MQFHLHRLNEPKLMSDEPHNLFAKFRNFEFSNQTQINIYSVATLYLFVSFSEVFLQLYSTTLSHETSQLLIVQNETHIVFNNF